MSAELIAAGAMAAPSILQALGIGGGGGQEYTKGQRRFYGAQADIAEVQRDAFARRAANDERFLNLGMEQVFGHLANIMGEQPRALHAPGIFTHQPRQATPAFEIPGVVDPRTFSGEEEEEVERSVIPTLPKPPTFDNTLLPFKGITSPLVGNIPNLTTDQDIEWDFVSEMAPQLVSRVGEKTDGELDFVSEMAPQLVSRVGEKTDGELDFVSEMLPNLVSQAGQRSGEDRTGAMLSELRNLLTPQYGRGADTTVAGTARFDMPMTPDFLRSHLGTDAGGETQMTGILAALAQASQMAARPGTDTGKRSMIETPALISNARQPEFQTAATSNIAGFDPAAMFQMLQGAGMTAGGGGRGDGSGGIMGLSREEESKLFRFVESQPGRLAYEWAKEQLIKNNPEMAKEFPSYVGGTAGLGQKTGPKKVSDETMQKMDELIAQYWVNWDAKRGIGSSPAASASSAGVEQPNPFGENPTPDAALLSLIDTYRDRGNQEYRSASSSPTGAARFEYTPQDYGDIDLTADADTIGYLRKMAQNAVRGGSEMVALFDDIVIGLHEGYLTIDENDKAVVLNSQGKPIYDLRTGEYL
jgi:hypothetical protein